MKEKTKKYLDDLINRIEYNINGMDNQVYILKKDLSKLRKFNKKVIKFL